MTTKETVSPFAFNGGRLAGAFHCTNGDVVLFNWNYRPMFKWEAQSGRVLVYTAGAPKPDAVERTETYWRQDQPYPAKFFAQVLGDWITASAFEGSTRCPRLPRALLVRSAS